MSSYLKSILDITEKATTQPTETGVPNLYMIRGNVPNYQLAALYKPMIGFTVQGTKTLSIGERTIAMKGPSYFVLPLHVPATAITQNEGKGKPYTSLGLEINQQTLQKLLRDLPETMLPKAVEHFDVCEIQPDLIEAWYRMLNLMNHPADIPALAPVYEREIIYRVLMGPQGWYLRQLGMKQSNFTKISQIVQWIRGHYMQDMDVKQIAEKYRMALNTLHRQFKQATGLSPIQFQKQLRLLEARSLIAFEGYAVAGAAYEVGYQSASQFNREYSRFFGDSPAKDVQRLKLAESGQDLRVSR